MLKWKTYNPNSSTGTRDEFSEELDAFPGDVYMTPNNSFFYLEGIWNLLGLQLNQRLVNIGL